MELLIFAEKEVLEHWKNDWLLRDWLLHDVSCKEKLRKMYNSATSVIDISRGRTVIN